MATTTLPWLDGILGGIAGAAFVLLLAVNGAFAAGLLLTRDRRFVDRWTKPLVVTDAALLVAAVGAPVVGVAVTLGAKGMALLGGAAVKLIPSK